MTGPVDVPPTAVDDGLREEVTAEAEQYERYALLRRHQRPGLPACTLAQQQRAATPEHGHHGDLHPEADGVGRPGDS
ncbi:hypothetical protein [Streptomyces zaehneri]|uniref:hypothetical protein n=1 Tax=Streptomyces zaehneri TaxID=3051180 RepID=UPI0028D8D912|nr:hypothetical protein [Streptomyces sp. DSM 40713]